MNQGLPAYGKMSFVRDEDDEIVVVLSGDFEPLVGQEVEARPIKVQSKTLISEVAKIDVEGGTILDRDTLIFGTATVSDMVVSLAEMGESERNSVVKAVESVNEKRYGDLVSFVASRVPGKVDFKIVE